MREGAIFKNQSLSSDKKVCNHRITCDIHIWEVLVTCTCQVIVQQQVRTKPWFSPQAIPVVLPLFPEMKTCRYSNADNDQQEHGDCQPDH